MAKRYSDSSKDVLVLRACAPDLSSRDGFVYPKRGKVRDPKFQHTHNCSNGLHGFLWGRGDDHLIPQYARPRGKWLVIRVARDQIIDLGGKVKVESGSVVFCGSKKEAGSYVAQRRPRESSGWSSIVHDGSHY